MTRSLQVPDALLSVVAADRAGLTVRRLQAEDLLPLIATCASAGEEQRFAARWEQALRNSNLGRALPLVACYQGEPIGHGQLLLYRLEGEIADVGVADAWRNLGVGTVLVEALVASARHLGMRRVEIGVRAGNERVLALYRRLGFRLCRQIRVPGDDEPSWILEAELQAGSDDVA